MINCDLSFHKVLNLTFIEKKLHNNTTEGDNHNNGVPEEIDTTHGVVTERNGRCLELDEVDEDDEDDESSMNSSYYMLTFGDKGDDESANRKHKSDSCIMKLAIQSKLYKSARQDEICTDTLQCIQRYTRKVFRQVSLIDSIELNY